MNPRRLIGDRMRTELIAYLGLALVLPFAACMGTPEPESPTSSAPAAAPGCDGPVEPQRIRSREIDLAVDPNDRNRLAAGMMSSIPATRTAPPDDEPVWIRIVRSHNGGATWVGADLPASPGSTDATSPIAGSAVTGDPVVAFLPDGTLLLSGIMIRADYSYNMFSARFEGDSLEPTDVVTFSSGAYGDPRLNDIPSPGTVLYNDKQEVHVDPETGVAYISWMWRHNSPTEGVRSVPVVVMSTDGGKSWSDPKMLFGGLGGGLTSDEANIGMFPVTTSDGNAHIVWYAEGAQEMMISSARTGTLDFGSPRAIATQVSLSSAARAIGSPLPSVAVGPGPSGVGEALYVAWSDSRSGDADVLVIRSDDHAKTWTEPVSITAQPDTAGLDQLVPVIAVSPSGRLGAHYIQFSADVEEYEAYAAFSDDGGATSRVVKVSSEATRISEAAGQRGTGIQAHVGDYFGAAFTDDAFFAMWQDGREGSAETPYTSAYVCRLETGRK